MAETSRAATRVTVGEMASDPVSPAGHTDQVNARALGSH